MDFPTLPPTRPMRLLAADSVLTALDGGGLRGVPAATLADAVYQDVHEQAAAGSEPLVLTELRWGAGGGMGGLHWVSVTDVKDDRVYLRNTQMPMTKDFQRFVNGEADWLPVKTEAATGRKYVEVGGPDDRAAHRRGTPPRRIYEDGTTSVAKAWFAEHVMAATVHPLVAARAGSLNKQITSSWATEGGPRPTTLG